MISLVIPLYNEDRQIESLVNHLAALSGIVEIIFVDASDEPACRLKLVECLETAGLSDRSQLLLSDTAGRAQQMNMGARAATQSVLLFLHCDTRLPARASSLIDIAIRNGKVWGRFDVNFDQSGWVFRLIETMINFRSRCRRLATGDQGIFVKRELFLELDGFPRIPLMEDIAISRVLAQHGKPALIRDPVTTSARRWSNSGVLRTILLMWKLRLLFWLGRSPEKLALMYRHIR
ncbi:MAG: glycosyltransferase [Gammaproteobacteria bacterium]|nr:glycosyltransferase [Gammaproteobacteria bacterium]